METSKNPCNAHPTQVFNMTVAEGNREEKQPAAFVKTLLFQEKCKHKTEDGIKVWWLLM